MTEHSAHDESSASPGRPGRGPSLPGDGDGHQDVVAAVEHFTVAAVALTERALVETAALADLSLAQWRMLSLLHQAPHPPRLADVAAAAGLSAPSASRMVARLAGRGLIVSTIDLMDRRAIRIRLTQAGREVVRAVMEARRTEIANRLAGRHWRRGFAAALDQTAAALDASW